MCSVVFQLRVTCQLKSFLLREDLADKAEEYVGLKYIALKKASR